MERKKLLGFLVPFAILGLFLTGIALGDEGDGTLPVGSIIMWSGDILEFDVWGNMINDTQWHLCNGNNGTIDLQGRFVVGYDEEQNDYDELEETGGEDFHTLTIAEMPYHEHAYIDIFSNTNGRNIANGFTTNSESLTSSNSNTGGAGGNRAHENRPQYTVVAFIQRIY